MLKYFYNHKNMRIFRGWFFYLVIAILMVIAATVASHYYNSPGGKADASSALLAKVPTLNVNLNASLLSAKDVVSSSTKVNIAQAAQKIASSAPEKLAITGGVKGFIFSYLSGNSAFLAKQGFDFSQGADKNWDFSYETAHGAVKLFSLKP